MSSFRIATSPCHLPLKLIDSWKWFSGSWMYSPKAEGMPPKARLWVLEWVSVITGSGGASIKIFAGGGAKGSKKKRTKNVFKNACEGCQNLPFLGWNCQMWAKLNTFEIILGGNLGEGQNKYFGGPNAPLPPWWHHHWSLTLNHLPKCD